MDKGAHFHRCDFQVHSPRDLNWHGGSVTRYGDTLLVVIENPITNESFFRPYTDFKSWAGLNYALGLSPRNVLTGPGHNVTQIIWWTEKYNPSVKAPSYTRHYRWELVE